MRDLLYCFNSVNYLLARNLLRFVGLLRGGLGVVFDALWATNVDCLVMCL